MTNIFKKISLSVLLIVAIGAVMLISQSDRSTSEGEIIKIGVIVPLTGGGALFGNSLAGGVKMALEDLRDTRYQYQLVVEDDQSSPTKAASAASKIITVDKVKAIITTTSGTGNAVASIAQNSKVLHMCVCSDPAIAKAGNYNFNNLVFPEVEAERWVSEAKRRGYKKIASISQQHPGVNAVVDAVRQELGEQGFDLVIDDRFPAETKDFKTLLLKAKQSNPDVYFVNAFPPAIDLIGQAYSELQIQEPLSSSAGLTLASKKELFEGSWYVDSALTNEDFIRKFHDQFSEVQFNTRTAPYGYDSVNMLIETFENGKTEPVRYLNNLKNFQGEVGQLTQVERRFSSPAGIWEINNGNVFPLR